MRQTTRFKNPDDLLETEDELDELGDDMDVALGPDNDSDASISDIEIEPHGEDDDDIDFEPEEDDEDDVYVESCSDSEMTSIDSEDDEFDKDLEENEQAIKHTAAKETTQTESDAAGSSVSHLNEEDEDDETVRAIIAAIKKPRSAPPEIKLDDFITDICFHPEEHIVALATITGDVHLYEYSNDKNTLLRCIEVHAKACRDVEFTEDGRDLITCSKDKSIMITDMFTEKLKKFYESAHDDAINTLYVLDQNLFATGDDVGTVKLWDLRTKESIFALKECEDYVTQIMSNDAKKLLICTSGDGYLTTINIGARKLYVQSEPYEEEFNCMGIYRGDSKLVVGTSKGRLYTYNWGQFGYHCDMFPGIKTPISKMVPITDRIGCVAGEEGIIRACHIAPFRNLGIVGQHTMPIECMDINTTGELVASSSHSNDLRFWNVKYFEEFGDIKYNEKHNPAKEKRHNLPSSKFTNNSDFFADLAKPASDE